MQSRTNLLVVVVIILTSLFQQCKTDTSVQLDIISKPFEKLSDYQFFVGSIADLKPNDGVLPYGLNTTLFSDYSQKARFVWMPQGVSASHQENGVLGFPIGTVLIKNFYYYHDDRNPTLGREIIETRLLVHRKDGWDALAYVWNDEQTEAVLSPIGDIRPVSWVDGNGASKSLEYLIPNKNQCKSCHSYENKLQPIGPKSYNLNRNFVYGDDNTNQLQKWVEVNYLASIDAKEKKAQLAVWNDSINYNLHERAMAYLDVNCGHCHNSQGPANTSGLHLTHDQVMNIDLGIMKSPVAAGKGSGGRSYNIVPGHPEASVLLYRMQITDPGAMMPEIGRQLLHREGIELIEQWITEMN